MMEGMIRTQIQLPDDVFARARKLCEAREMSLAELARRGIEYLLGVYAPSSSAIDEWLPPKPRRLGWKGLDDAAIKAQAQATSSQIASARSRNR
jgi:hypothetical protein